MYLSSGWAVTELCAACISLGPEAVKCIIHGMWSKAVIYASTDAVSPCFEVEVEDEEKNLKAMEWVGPPDWAAVKKMQGW